MKKLPEKTVERLSQYRRILLETKKKEKFYIFSHELASLAHSTAVQVRRDIMLLGCQSKQKKGYDIQELITTITELIDSRKGLNVAIVGMGNLGKAIAAYFMGKTSKLSIVAGFDVEENKIERMISGVKCYHINKMQEIIQNQNISIAILTIPPDQAHIVTESLIQSGIKGIINYTANPINVPPHIHLEEHDILTFLEKTAYFVKMN